MILKIDGNINRYYVQTLCMVFFPGATFSESEQPGTDVPEVNVRLCRAGDIVSSVATIRIGEKQAMAEGHYAVTEAVSSARAEKIAVGRAVLGAGKEFFSYAPPWGILTGVRPAKVATELILKGNGIRNSRGILRDEYFVAPRKAALAVSVASTELKLTSRLPDNLCSVYISIPFCPSRCAYCSFVSYTSDKLLSLVDDYLSELYRDIDNIFSIIRELGLRVATVYIGGGTPTVLSPDRMARLLDKIGENVDPGTLMEFTVEAGRPDTITREKLDAIRMGGAGRISVNPQTLSDEVLRSIGRRHTVEDFYRAYSVAREAGIGAVNVDMIASVLIVDIVIAGYCVPVLVFVLRPFGFVFVSMIVVPGASVTDTVVIIVSVSCGISYGSISVTAGGCVPVIEFVVGPFLGIGVVAELIFANLADTVVVFVGMSNLFGGYEAMAGRYLPVALSVKRVFVFGELVLVV